MCGRDVSTPVNTSEMLRCYPFRLEDIAGSEGDVTLVIDSVLEGGQASLHFRGEAYVAAAARQDADSDSTAPRRLCHLVHIRFESGSRSPVLKAPVVTLSTAAVLTPAPVVNSNESLTKKSPRTRQLAPLRESLSKEGSGGAADSGEGLSSDDSIRPKVPVSLSSASRSVAGFTYTRDAEYVPTLKAIGRAAMVGFHIGLAGAMRELAWGGSELNLVADDLPSGCFTLHEALSGGLYREMGVGDGRDTAKRNSGAVDVVDRMLTLARGTAAAISHCHRRGVSDELEVDLGVLCCRSAEFEALRGKGVAFYRLVALLDFRSCYVTARA